MKSFKLLFVFSLILFSRTVSIGQNTLWYNMGIGGKGGFYISGVNQKIKTLLRTSAPPAKSDGFYLGGYCSADIRDNIIKQRFEAGLRGTYFLKEIQSKLNFYGKAELSIFNNENDKAIAIRPRIGCGIRYRFLYAEAAISPFPYHVGLCWQWQARRKKKATNN